MTVSAGTLNTHSLLAADPSHQHGWGVSLQGDSPAEGGYPCCRSNVAEHREATGPGASLCPLLVKTQGRELSFSDPQFFPPKTGTSPYGKNVLRITCEHRNPAPHSS